MNKLRMIAMCLIAMITASLSVKAQEVTITLTPGWTWISCPGTEVQDFETALGSFTPQAGDMIKSQWGNATFRSDGHWRGNISQFYPGYGYKYYSTRMMPVIITMGDPLLYEMMTTEEPTDITAISAVVGGTVTIGEGNHIFARGVCWGTEPNPNIDGNHTSDVPVTGNLNDTLTDLIPNTTYYVRAYMVTDYGLFYGEELGFTTQDAHNYVDLGLPSGTLWATCNIGAETPEDYGDYFAWGETEPKSTYDWNTYQYCNGDEGWNTLIKYCNNLHEGYNGFTDSLTVLLPEDDAATINWGESWRTPTKEEWQELYENTTCTWTTLGWVSGRLFIATNGNSIFLPAGGFYSGNSRYNANFSGSYWSSSLNIDNPCAAWFFSFYSESYIIGNAGNRYFGQSVRAVRSLE